MEMKWGAIGVGLLLLYAVILVLLARRSSLATPWTVRPTLGRALAVGVLCVLLDGGAVWLLNPNAPDLAPIAVLVRSLLILTISVLGNVRIVQFMMQTSYAHACYLWLLSTVIFAGVVVGLVYLGRSQIEGWMNSY